MSTSTKVAWKGGTPSEIAAALTEQGIKSPMGNDSWSAGTVRSILRNEKYCGDALMQKTYTKDFRTHKSVKNTDLNMYFEPCPIGQSIALNVPLRMQKSNAPHGHEKTGLKGDVP